jgi:hypothetical protein
LNAIVNDKTLVHIMNIQNVLETSVMQDDHSRRTVSTQVQAKCTSSYTCVTPAPTLSSMSQQVIPHNGSPTLSPLAHLLSRACCCFGRAAAAAAAGGCLPIAAAAASGGFAIAATAGFAIAAAWWPVVKVLGAE